MSWLIRMVIVEYALESDWIELVKEQGQAGVEGLRFCAGEGGNGGARPDSEPERLLSGP